MGLLNKNHLVLLPLTMVSVGTYATDYFTVDQAQKVLFPKADKFVEQSTELSDEQREKIQDIGKIRQRNKTQQVWRAEQKGKLLGWFLVDEVIGKHEFITYAVALSPDGQVVALEIMSYRETKGGQVRNEAWRTQFKGKSLNDPFKLDVDIPNISGATLSCRNITDGVKRLLAFHKVVLTQ